MIEILLKNNWKLKIFFLVFSLFLFLVTTNEALAADRYWVGGTGNWSDATNHWATVSGGTPGAGNTPTSADNCFFNSASSASSYTVTQDVGGAVCLDMTWANPATGSPTFAGGSALGIYGSLTLVAGMTSTYTGYVVFHHSNTTKNITMNGVSFFKNDVIFGQVADTGTGSWVLQDSFTQTTTGTVYLTKGTLNTNNQTVSVNVFSSSNTNVRTLTLGSSAITVTRNNTDGWYQDVNTNFTMTANTATLTFTGATAEMHTPSSGTQDFNGLSVVFANTVTTGQITNGGTFANITVTGNASKTETFTLGSSKTTTVTGTFTVNGNSSINRVLIQSTTLGTAATINSATNSFSNVDFRDITGAGAASWNLSAITGLSGDSGGNSGITFTTATNQHFTNVNGGTWSTAANWTSRVPLPQDNVFMDAAFGTSKTVTMDMPRAGHSIDWTGATFTTALTWTYSNGWTMYGSLTVIGTSGFNWGSNWNVILEGRASDMPVGGWTVTSNGKTNAGSFVFSGFGATYILNDALSASNQVVFTAGDFNANNFNVTSGTTGGGGITLTNNSYTRTITMGSGTWTMSGTTAWSFSAATGLTLNPDTSTIVVTNTSTTAKTFAGGGLTYNNVTFSGDNITISGNNTFATMKINNAGLPNGLKLTSGTTQTVTNMTTNASKGLVAFLSATPSGNATITRATGIFCGEYMNIASSTVTTTGDATWYAANSTDVGNNVGWNFSQCPMPNTGTRDVSGPANEKVRGGIKVRGGVKFR